eukprot:GHVN01067576.1.p1 GENE.GHVN01067576.1~~GHVN01067576.1.p1  ORF type:complete len:151 (-),score=8.45 GHVN01067576.1:50-502(-)
MHLMLNPDGRSGGATLSWNHMVQRLEAASIREFKPLLYKQTREYILAPDPLAASDSSGVLSSGEMKLKGRFTCRYNSKVYLDDSYEWRSMTKGRNFKFTTKDFGNGRSKVCYDRHAEEHLIYQAAALERYKKVEEERSLIRKTVNRSHNG